MALRLARWLRTPEAHEGSFAQLAGRYRDEVACVGPGARRAGRGRRPGRAVRRLRPPGAGRGRPPGRVQPGVRASPWPTGPAAARTPARSSASRTCWPGRSADVLDAEGPRPAGRARRDELAGRATSCWPTCGGTTGSRRPCRGPTGRRPRSSPRSPASPSSRGRACWPGWLIRGKQDDERRLFPVVPALLSRCERNFPPLLFHKGQLTEGSRGVPAGAVVAGDPDAENRVVARRDQRRRRPAGRGPAGPRHLDGRGDPPARRPAPSWPASRAGRWSWPATTATSGTATRPPRPPPAPTPAGGPPTAPPDDGEVLLEGPRVRGAEGDAPADRPLGRGRPLPRGPQNGYHGGATPQEMVAPLVSWPTRPPASPCRSRASRAGRPGGTGRTPGDPPRPTGRRRPRRPTQDPRRLPVPAGAAGRGRGPVHAPARRPPSRPRRRPTPAWLRPPVRVAGLPGPAADGPQVRARGRGRREGPGGPGPPGRRDHARRAGPPGRGPRRCGSTAWSPSSSGCSTSTATTCSGSTATETASN